MCAIDNDDLLAAAGEATVGAAIGRRSVAYVSFGYGLGAGILIEGRPVRGASGGAGAIAYLAGGRLADAAAGHAIPARYAARANVATPVGWLDARTVAERATTGDKAAAATLEAAIVALAEGVVDVAALLDPEVIVLGGGVVAGSKRAFAAVEDALRVLPFPPPVVPSALGDDAVLQGAVALALALVRERAADVGPRSAKHRFATESLELVGRQPGPATAPLEVSP